MDQQKSNPTNKQSMKIINTRFNVYSKGSMRNLDNLRLKVKNYIIDQIRDSLRISESILCLDCKNCKMMRS